MSLPRRLPWSKGSFPRIRIQSTLYHFPTYKTHLHRTSAHQLNFQPTRHASSSATSPIQPSSTTSDSPKSKNTSRWTRLAIAGAVIGAVYGWDHYFNARTLERNTRTVWNGLMLVVDYKLNYDPENLESMNAVHERAAARLLHVCRKNGGLYVKAGQAIGIQAAILPKAYHVLAQMFDGASPIPIDQVREVIHSELGMWPEELFKEFDEKPIGSASVAQVHRATLHTGEQVAVKVQRPDIRKHAQWDLLAFRILMQIYERVFDLPLTFASQYISDQIELETHFDHERMNTERIRGYVLNDPPKHLKGGVAYVPKVYESLSTERLMVLEYIDGAVRMTDVKGMQRLGLDPEQVMKSVCEVFAAQVFRWGFVNADPHPSNVLIRQHPSHPSTHQIVLIDHGLSIPLPPTFRYQYLQLWKALFNRDVEGMKAVCKSWGVDLGEGGLGAQLLGSAVLLQGWSGEEEDPRVELGRSGGGAAASGGSGGSTMKDRWRRHSRSLRDRKEEGDTRSQEEKEADEKRELEIQKQMKATVKGFLENYEMIPKELIFLGRSMRIIQAGNQALGSPVDRISILAKGASDGIYDMILHPPELESRLRPVEGLKLRNKQSWLSRYIDANFDWFTLRLEIAKMNVAARNQGLVAWVLWVQRSWRVFKRRVRGAMAVGGRAGSVGDKGEGGGEMMQRHAMEMARGLGVELTEEAFKG